MVNACELFVLAAFLARKVSSSFCTLLMSTLAPEEEGVI